MDLTIEVITYSQIYFYVLKIIQPHEYCGSIIQIHYKTCVMLKLLQNKSETNI